MPKKKQSIADRIKGKSPSPVGHGKNPKVIEAIDTLVQLHKAGERLPTYADVCQVLADEGVSISQPTIRTLLRKALCQ